MVREFRELQHLWKDPYSLRLRITMPRDLQTGFCVGRVVGQRVVRRHEGASTNICIHVQVCIPVV
jgi:hypothetical protein